MTVCVLFTRLGPYHHARLDAAGRKLNVIALELCGYESTYAWDRLERAGSYRRVTLFADGAKLTPLRVMLAVTHWLARERPDVVAVNGWSSASALAAIGWCRATGRHAVLMSESQAIDAPRVGWREWLKRRIVSNCAAALVGGATHEAYLRELGMPRECIFTGYDTVDNAHFVSGSDGARANADELRARHQLPARYFLASSRFIAKKNLTGLLTAFAAYRREMGSSAFDLVLLGDGPLRGDLLAERDRLAISAHVHLLGFKQYDELPIYYGLAESFIHVSTVEQWGLVVNEAMASALPVIVSHATGAAELVSHGENGFVVDARDLTTITAALSRITREPNRAAMGRAARARVAALAPDAFAAGLARAIDAARGGPAIQVDMEHHLEP